MDQPAAVQYRMIKTRGYAEGSGKIMTYGVCCREDKRSPGQLKVKYQVIPDISTKSGFVEELVRQLTVHEADPAHLADLVNDYLP